MDKVRNLVRQMGMGVGICTGNLAEVRHQRFNAAVIQQVLHSSYKRQLMLLGENEVIYIVQDER